MVVEDDKDAREIVGELLVFEGAKVRLASDGAMAMAELRQSVPDVMVSDISMPRENGYSLIRRCRESSDPQLRNVPALALTAYTTPSDRQKALACGFNELVEKPVDLFVLVAAVARLAGMQST